MEIKKFITEYENGTVKVTPQVSYNLKDVIDESYRLYNAKFETDTDNAGVRKIFYRMIWVIFRTIVMSSDIDLKDINIRSLNGKGIRTLALVKLAVHSHLLRTFFGKYIDKVMADMVWFGTSITKRFNGRVDSVDLRNIIRPPHIKDIQESGIAELCYYNYDEIQSYKDQWKENWLAVESLWEKMQEVGETRFKIIEYWTWFEQDGKTHKGCIKYLDNTLKRPDEGEEAVDWNPYLEVDRFITPYKKKRTSKWLREKLGDEEEMFPYEQIDLFDAPGRWLGFGCAELLSGLQEHYNETFNLKRKKDILDLRGIFIHNYSPTSNSLRQEFLDNFETGDVVQLAQDESLQRLVIDTKTAEFINNVDKLYEIMRLVMGVTAQGTGEELPGSTSATGVKVNYAAQVTTYDYVRERMHHFVQALFMNGYFEDIMDEISNEDMAAIVGDPKDLATLDKPLIENAVRQKTVERYNYIQETKGEVTFDDVYMLQELEDAEIKVLTEELQKMGDTRWASVKKKLLKGLNYVIEFFVNNETFDKQSKLEMYQAMLANPNYSGSRKAIEDAIFDLMNENPRQFDKTPDEKAAEVEMMRNELLGKNATALTGGENAAMNGGAFSQPASSLAQ